MKLHYVDASAWGKLIVDEPETNAMLDHLDSVRADGGHFVSSQLLMTELHRAGARLSIPAAGVADALGEVALLMPDRDTFELAARLAGPHLRSLDAIHVAAAVQAQATTFVTYDERQAAAASDAGLRIISPV